ncbi:cytochrome b reductase 1 isoform X2 [Orussus abietinus]|uniref:cytochrome b reductase 1 isoform X2 n=1 Tax=Orussus abietinus TaxID=222816 RepID=UPI000626C16F|nr:cytochrome b reductase 1 isoform X2 [Orussus abietinus]XP_012275347.1 cytochrome b reductase 1 isoform X2 [Orussus abietinus]XP_012275351.1 cytochrome b reductase 1 isoform X2 [Orussus abietinus]
MTTNYEYEYQICEDMDQIGEPSQNKNLEGFGYLLTATEVFGVLLIILVIVWTTCYRDGFAWSSYPKQQFNWHPLLMTIGLVFLYANAMLIYRSQRTVRKRRLKLLHAGMMIFSLLLTIIALVAVFDSHNLNKPEPIPNMYSLHSWVGLTSVILFCCQWVAGCVSFLYPGIQSQLRAVYMPVHVYFGTAGFIGVIASCLLGLNEKAIFAVSNYSDFPPEGILVNVIGVVLIVFGGLTVYLSSQHRYKRLPRPEDDILLTGASD